MQQANGRTLKASAWLGTSSSHNNALAIRLHFVHSMAFSADDCKLTAGDVAEEEVMYTLFNLAQFLGFVEVVRREGPREDAFLQAGNPQGSDTLATLVEGLRFVMSAASGNLVVSVFHNSSVDSAYYQQPLIGSTLQLAQVLNMCAPLFGPHVAR